MASGSGPVPRHRGRLAYWLQDDLVGAEAEELPKPAHLGHLRHPPPALPEVDRLWLDAYPQRELELGPSLFKAECPDRLHSVPHFTVRNYNRFTNGKQLKQLLYSIERWPHGDCRLLIHDNVRSDIMKSLDLAKEDMTFDYGERSFRLRAFRDEGSWHSIIIENKTPMRNCLPPTADAVKCFAEAVAFVRIAVDTARHDASAAHRGRHLDAAYRREDPFAGGVRETESSD